MSSKKDMRRADLVVPFMEPANQKEGTDIQSTMASTLPMAAIFTRNKMIGWTAVVFAVQGWLAETPESAKTASTPGLFSVAMALLSVGVSYMGLFMPPQVGRAGAASGTEAPSAVPSSS